MTGNEFMEKNLTGSRKGLYRILVQGIWQGGGNTAPINTETLRYLTQAELELAEIAMSD